LHAQSAAVSFNKVQFSKKKEIIAVGTAKVKVTKNIEQLTQTRFIVQGIESLFLISAFLGTILEVR